MAGVSAIAEGDVTRKIVAALPACRHRKIHRR